MNDEKKLYRIINYGTKYQKEEMFKYIYDKYKPLIIFVATRYLNDDEDIKDVVQDTFIDFFKVANKEHQNIKAYLTIACKHNAIDLLKQKKRLYLMDDVEINSIIDEITPHPSYIEIFNELKHYLSSLEIEIITYHLVDGMTFEEIGKLIHSNTNSIKSTYYRAIKKFQKMKGIK